MRKEKAITFLIDFQLCIIPAFIFYVFFRAYILPLFPAMPNNIGEATIIIGSMTIALGNALIFRKHRI